MSQITHERTSTLKPGDLLARAEKISGIISAEADSSESLGRMTDVAVAALMESELPWALIPQEWGGLGGTDVLEIMDAIEEIAFADGSAGWVLMVHSFGGSILASVLDPTTAESLFGVDTRGTVCGQAAPLGRAVRTEGGYRVTGRWQFGSGSNSATFVGGGCFVFDADGSMITENGEPVWIMPFMDLADVKQLGNWDVGGLRATASWDYSVNDLFVPDAMVVPLPTPALQHNNTVLRLGFLSSVYAQHVSFTLGVLKRAFSEIVSIVADKTRVGYDGTVGESPVFLYEFAQREAQYQAVRAYSRQVFAEAQDEPGGPTDLQQARIHVACAWMARESDDLIKWCHSWGGSAAVRTPNALTRCLNDIAVASNHLYVDRMNLVGPTPIILESWKS
ncbi:acyl-CoA dehydrogenase family protein [soil metagenome]